MPRIVREIKAVVFVATGRRFFAVYQYFCETDMQPMSR